MGGNLAAGFIIGGHSAGAQNAAVVSQMALDQDLQPSITGTFLMIIGLFIEEIVPSKYKQLWTSYTDNANVEGYNSALIVEARKGWDPDWNSPWCSPFNAAKPHVRHSRTYLQVCELDPHRDDGQVYEAALSDAGVETRIDELKGLIHQTYCTVVDEKLDLREMRQMTMEGMGWLLRKGE